MSRAPRNKTLTLTAEDEKIYSERLVNLCSKKDESELINKTILQDTFEAAKFLPDKFVDLLFIDPPYNLNKTFNSNVFKSRSIKDYSEWFENLIIVLRRCVKPDASIYVCGDWYSSTSLHEVLQKYFIVRNRITWERDKGRGSKSNWKNNTEDIWYCTASDKFKFNPESVKLKRRVIAPYREGGKPKDWQETAEGDFRLTYASNIWNDISIPFWSMKENTNHPTQKPEKLLAKIILASTDPGDLVFDPFGGSGTAAVVAKKLSRNYLSVEIDKEYACITEKRLQIAEEDKRIQGFADGVFWERNSNK